MSADDAASCEPGLLHEHFARSLRAHPSAVALEVPPGPGRPARVRLSYLELERLAARLAAGLRGLVEGECVVALLLPRHAPELFAAELAALRVGAAFTCLDPAFPDAHARFVLADCGAVALLTDAAGRARALEWGLAPGRVLDVAQLARGPVADAPVPAWLTPSSLAYVIYTSGTTGRPKGVALEHAGIASLVASDREEFALAAGDRVAQGSSHAYDSSLEETWLAFAAGATAVVLDDEAARLGPDLVAWLRDERISVLCPPPTLLRASGCSDPRRELPDLRLLYVGGEALPEDLAALWAPGRRLVNGYGPTECSVTVVRGDVRAGEPVTIGRPVRGHSAWVLDASLEEVPDGQPGELCLSGVGLARGYLGRPELTAERFPLHPRLGRLYRTGDLVRRDARGELAYLGRLDAQVKLRGHRIELEAVEARLCACAGVREAAAHVQRDGAGEVLVAFVVAAGGAALRPEALREALRAELPAPMVPARIGLLDALPRSVGGKLDRGALPRLEVAAAAERPRVAPRDDLERRVLAALRGALGVVDEPSIEDDFFLDLGGDSLRAAEAVSHLRDDPSTARLTVRDLYAARTAAALAERARAVARAGPGEPERADPDLALRGKPLAALVVQGLALTVELFLAAATAYLVTFELLPWLLRGLGLTATVLLLPPSAALLPLLALLPSVAATVLAKRLLIGTYVPLRAPVWGGFHVRSWLLQQVAATIPWGLLQGTVLASAVLRALGARVGRRVHVHHGVDLLRGGWDLLEIGDDVTLAQDSAVRLVDLVDGELVVAPVRLGEQSTLDVRAAVSGGASLGRGAHLAPHAWLPPGASVPDGERWDGIPARPAGPAEDAPAGARAGDLPPALHGLLLVLLRLFSRTLAFVPLAAILLALAGLLRIDAARVLAWIAAPAFEPGALALLALGVCASVPLGLLAQVASLRMLGRNRHGVVGGWSLAWLRASLKIDMARFAGTWLSGTVLWPVWLRWAGMRVGRNCEISTLVDCLPELVELGDESFLADGVYLGAPWLYRGAVTIAPARLGRRTFLGNHAVVRAGQRLPDDLLLGVCTVADESHLRAGSSWFGHPPFELPRPRPAGLDRRLTHEPDALRRATRVVWELARFVLPLPPLAIALAWFAALAAVRPGSGLVELLALHAPWTALLASWAAVLLVLGLKWLLLGRVRPGEHPLWSCWCSRWDFLYVAWGFVARPLLARLEGTLFLPWYLRAMGARIGRRVVLGGGFAQVVDPDMLELDDGATVNGLFQAHSFEDRVLKVDRVRVGPGASVEAGAVLFYGADVGRRARVLPHAVVMKHERLPARRAYAGAPAGPVG